MSDSRKGELPESRLYFLLDEPAEIAVYFLEGQRLIRDLALLHDIRGEGFAYFRQFVLSVQPMISLIKRGEQMGFYVDSEDPFFRLKIETGHQGDVRCVLTPEEFSEFPESMRGIVRLQRLFPANRPPYESILRADGLPLREVVNRVLRDSYQVNCAVRVSGTSDQSAMLHQLPPLRGHDDEASVDAVSRRRDRLAEGLDALFARAISDPQDLATALAGLGLRTLASRRIRFHCNCDRERMIRNVLLVIEDDGSRMFDPGRNTMEVTCGYCKKRYVISRDELRGAAALPN